MTTTPGNNVVAIFPDYETARKAQQDLVQNGFSQQDIQISSSGDATAVAGQSSVHNTQESEGGISGFFHRLFGSDDADTDNEYRDIRGRYNNAVQSGRVLLSITVDDNRIDAATDILDKYDPIDIDQSGDNYHEQTFTGAKAGMSSEPPYQAAAGQQTLNVVEEDLQVGKRSVVRGGVRIYSTVTSRPVEEQISLREEHVHVERRPVDRAATEADFRTDGKTIEMVETGEEAVVSKTARVVEEVVIGKDTTQRNETIRETLRRTDVKVDEMAASAGSVGSDNDPAYRYGSEIASDPQYTGKDWASVEGSLRSDYERRNPNSKWETSKANVRRGWDQITNKR